MVLENVVKDKRLGMLFLNRARTSNALAEKVNFRQQFNFYFVHAHSQLEDPMR